uniref:Putative methyltransferase n=2 Tax=viral metagenome TaxID=1070528 RepID=A0A6M3X7I5_9ZZZZ
MMNFPNRKYNIILADPPWKFIGWSINKSGKKSPANHYECQDLDWIKSLPINKLADKDCILFLWATYPTLEISFEVIKEWGFKYATCGFTWIKTTKNNKWHFGLGYWTRANPEICLIGVKGHPKRIDKSIPNLIVSRVMEHSKKPDEVRSRIVQLIGNLPRIELFAREQVDGWDALGNEVDGMDIQDSLTLLGEWFESCGL